MSGANFNQEGHMRVLYTRFRACSDAHRDFYHADCDKCLMVESNTDRCMDTSHVRDTSGQCLTCELFNAREETLSAKEDARLLYYIKKYTKKGRI